MMIIKTKDFAEVANKLVLIIPAFIAGLLIGKKKDGAK